MAWYEVVPGRGICGRWYTYGMNLEFLVGFKLERTGSCLTGFLEIMASSMAVDSKTKFSCSCGDQFEFRKQLVSHVHSSHATDRVDWICNICEATFPMPLSLRAYGYIGSKTHCHHHPTSIIV